MATLELFGVGLFAALAQAAPYVVIGYLIAALIREFVAIETLTDKFGAAGVGPVARAVSAGALLPICSCGVIPLGVGLVRGGAAIGTTLAFMFSAPAISPVAVILAWNVLGPTLTSAYVVAVLLGSLLLGLGANRVFGGPAIASAAPPVPERPGLAARIRSALRWAFWDLGSDVSVDLLLGLAIAAALLAFVPPGWIAAWLGRPGLLSLLLAIALAVPTYTCTVPSIPVVRTLLLLGVSPGAALALLIAGPATNLGEINVIRAQLGARAAALYVGAIVVTALGAGLVVDRVVFVGYQYQAVEIAGQLVINSCCVPAPFAPGSARPDLAAVLAQVPAWHVPFIGLLILTLGCGLARRAHARLAASAPPLAAEGPPA